MSFRAVVVSWDFILSLAIAATFGFWLPLWVPNELTKDYYGIGISVLSIVFSLFFAALAVVITASDDDFVMFLEAHGIIQHSLKITGSRWRCFLSPLCIRSCSMRTPRHESPPRCITKTSSSRTCSLFYSSGASLPLSGQLMIQSNIQTTGDDL